MLTNPEAFKPCTQMLLVVTVDFDCSLLATRFYLIANDYNSSTPLYLIASDFK